MCTYVLRPKSTTHTCDIRVTYVYIRVTSQVDHPYHILRPHAVKDFIKFVLFKFCFTREGLGFRVYPKPSLVKPPPL